MSSPARPALRRVTSSASLRLLIVEDNPMSAELLTDRIKRSNVNVGRIVFVTSREQVVDAVKANDLGVALVSEQLHDGHHSGLEVLDILRKSTPSVRSILLARALPPALVLAAFRHGAKGVFCRSQPIQLLCRCIRAVHQGQIWVNSQQMETLLVALVEHQPVKQPPALRSASLTKREEEVAALVVQGMTNREIATRLGLKDHTIGNYLFRCYEKLGLSTRVELVLYMLRQQSVEASQSNAKVESSV